MLSCEVWETFKNAYFEEHLKATASEGVLYTSWSWKLCNIHWAKVASDKVFHEKGVLGGELSCKSDVFLYGSASLVKKSVAG